MISNLINISGTSSPRIERSEQCCPSGSVTNSTPNIEAYRYPTLFVGYLVLTEILVEGLALIVRCARYSLRSNPLFDFSQELDRKSELLLLINAIVEQLLLLDASLFNKI